MTQYQELGRRRTVGRPGSAQDDWARGLRPADRPLGFFDGGFMAALTATVELDLPGRREEAWRERLWDRHLLVRELTGETPHPSQEMLTGPRGPSFGQMWEGLTTPGRAPTADQYEAQLDAILGRVAPEVRARIQSRDGLWQDQIDWASGLEQRRSQTSWAAQLAGGAIGQFADLENVGVALVGGAAGSGLRLVARAAIQGGLGGAVELTQVPGRFADDDFGGRPYSAGQAAFDVGAGALFGGLFEAGGAGVGWAGRRLGWFNPAEPVARGAQFAIEREATDRAALGSLPEGEVLDAISALDNFSQVRQPAAPHFDVSGPRGLPDPYTPEHPVSGSGEALIETPYQGRRILQARFDPLTLDVDPVTFQYKADGDTEGVTSRLWGVERWDPTSAGQVLVFEERSGRRVVADGHQRRGLARRLAEAGWSDEVQLSGYLFRQADGWTPREVRIVAALKNIREGSGAVLDAAKLFREAPAALRDPSLPITGDFIRQARTLARLSDDAFGAVANGAVPERHALAIGEMAAARPEMHADLLELLRQGKPGSLEDARALVAEGLLDDFLAAEGNQLDMFGGLPMKSTTVARGQIRASLMRLIRTDARMLDNVVKHASALEAGGNVLARDANEQALAVEHVLSDLISKLAMRHGPIGEALGDLAAAVTTGQTTAAEAARALAGRLRPIIKAGEHMEMLRAERLMPEAPAPEDLELATTFSDPGGAGQRGQLDPKPEDADLEAALDEPGLFETLPDEIGPLERALTALGPCAPGRSA